MGIIKINNNTVEETKEFKIKFTKEQLLIQKENLLKALSNIEAKLNLLK